jgi:hypothetical protein
MDDEAESERFIALALRLRMVLVCAWARERYRLDHSRGTQITRPSTVWTIMLLEDWESDHQSPRGGNRNGKSKRVFTTVLALVAAAVVAVGLGVAMKPRSLSIPSPKAISQAVAPPNTRPVTPPETWRLTFDATFTGTALNTQVWGTCYPGAAPDGCTNYGNIHDQELEWYLTSQVQVSGGLLHLSAQREPTAGRAKSGAAKEYACRSGMVTTYPSLRFKYGFIQIVAKIPFGKGLWPALWLAAANHEWPPEIDILEHWGTKPNGNTYLHPKIGARQGGVISTPNLSSRWHTFTLYWTKTQLSSYYDGNQVFSTTTGIPHQTMYLIANLADDQAGPGTCTGSLLIKSVKLWQP